MPDFVVKRLIRDFGLPPYDAFVLVQERTLANYFEAVLQEKVGAKLASNWIQSELLALLNLKKLSIEESPVKPADLAGLVRLIENNTINGKIAKDVLPEMFETGKSAEAIVKDKGLVQVTHPWQFFH